MVFIKKLEILDILWCWAISISLFSLVLYAAELGPCGLDTGTMYSREEVYELKNSDNVPFDYLPEDDSFRVVRIFIG